MRRRLHIDNLRTSDPVTLEVLVGDALRRPMAQLDPRTLTDLLALAEVDALPKRLRRDLEKFAGRISREITDLPDGGQAGLHGFCEDLDALPATVISEGLRLVLLEETDREGRPESSRERVRQTLARLEGTEPEALNLGQHKAKITRAAAPPPPKVVRSKVKGGRGEPAARTRKTTRTKAPEKPKLDLPGKAQVDDARRRWLVQQVMQRLGESSTGLKQVVLIAGLTHRARSEFPDLKSREILAVLEELKASGQVHLSAGRWSRPLRGW